jgi:DNA-binding response OmpR family regulator
MEPVHAPKRILLLDKGTSILTAVDELLLSGGWEVSITFDPNAVYDIAKKYRPDLVILDYLLLDNDCALICQDFKEDILLRSIPIIIVTAYKTKRISAQAYKCEALFVKPLDFEVLNSSMDYLLAS